MRARWAALAVTAVTLPIINPNWDVIYYILMLGFFALIGWAQLKVLLNPGAMTWSEFEFEQRLAVASMMFSVGNTANLGNWLVSGVLDRFPKLKLVLLEPQAHRPLPARSGIPAGVEKADSP